MDKSLIGQLEDAIRNCHQFFDSIKKFHDGGDGLSSVEIILKIKKDEEVKKLLKIFQ